MNGRAVVHILGYVKDGKMQIALAEVFYRALDLGIAALEGAAATPAERRRRALFRRGVPLQPSSVWLARLAEAANMDHSELWQNEAD